MRTQDIIAAKRDGKELSEHEIERIVLCHASGEIPDYQMSAFLMAAFLKGLSFDETFAMTKAMIQSGRTLDLSSIAGVKVDKHSTGGVGDKTTLVIAPILAACGLKVPKMSGRGLGFTGGTLDKLESIPGFNTALGVDALIAQVKRIGIAMAGQSAEIVPADKRIYALRDVTATVDSMPLIAASVMSKKIACGSDVILLDVKVGSGAFMKDIRQARLLARTMVELGLRFERRVGAAITDMDQPLGSTVGNALEVEESIRTLRGEGPDDLTTLCIELSALLVWMSGMAGSTDEGRDLAKSVLANGAALRKLTEVIEAQGGDARVVDNPSLLPRASLTEAVPSPSDGIVSHIDAQKIGIAAGILGAGRERVEDRIDPSVGITLLRKVGDWTAAGEPLAILHASQSDGLEQAKALVLAAYQIGDSAQTRPLIREVISRPRTKR